jgi:hypothetical protein
MADRYWVGGTGTWNSSNTGNWSATSGGASGASAPTSADNVIINSSSGSAGMVVTIATGAVCNDFTQTATGFLFTLSAAGSFSIYGSLSLDLFGGTVSGTGSLTFAATTTGKTIGGNGLPTAGSVFFDGVGGGWTLTSGLGVGQTSGDLYMVNGTLSTSASNYSITIQSVLRLNGGTLTLNGSTITASSLSGSATSVSTGTSTLVLTSTGATVTAAASWYNVTLTATSGGGKTVNSSVTISNTLTVYGPSAAGYMTCILGNGASIGAISTSGTAGNQRVYFSGSFGGASTISLTTTGSSCTNADFNQITFTTNTLTGTRLGDRLDNSGITFSTPKTVYWNLAGSQNWSATGWATSSGGSPNANNFPLPQDTAVFDNAGSITTVTIDLNWALPSIDFSGRTSSVTFATSTNSPTIYGSITLGSGVTISGTSSITFKNASTKTITSAGKTFTQSLTFDVGSTQLGGALTTSGLVTLSGGTFNTAGYAVSSLYFFSNTNFRTLTLGSSTWTITGSGATAWDSPYDANFTVSAASSTINMSSSLAKTFTGGTYTWGTLNQGGAGALTVVANGATFGNITNTTQPATITFTAGDTIYFNAFSLSGTFGNLITINSTTFLGVATLSKVGGGTVSSDYLLIRNSTATGASALWYAGANSTNSGNNLGWIFTAPPSSGMLFFFS